MRFLILRVLPAFAAIGLAAFLFVTSPDTLDGKAIAEIEAAAGDLGRGEKIFLIGGCASCHAAPDAKDKARLVLEGGHRLKSPFGTFVAPNISPDTENGIGGWTLAEFANAMLRGVSPDGRHYYPSFPYGSYRRMSAQDISDLWTYLRTLPKSPRPNEAHELGFPFRVRRGVGAWKWLYFDDAPAKIARIANETDKIARGRFLVEGPGHCGECHTPRDSLGGPDLDRWLAGGPNPEGKGGIPNITPGGKKFADWSEADIAEYLSSGFTPDYDSAGGAMVDVIANTSLLPAADRAAIAAYLKAVPAR